MKIQQLSIEQACASLHSTLDGLPENVLGYVRTFGKERIFILLNFGGREERVSIEATEVIFSLTAASQLDGNIVRLNGYGAMILK